MDITDHQLEEYYSKPFLKSLYSLKITTETMRKEKDCARKNLKWIKCCTCPFSYNPLRQTLSVIHWPNLPSMSEYLHKYFIPKVNIYIYIYSVCERERERERGKREREREREKERSDWLIDWLFDFNGMEAHLELFSTSR